MFGKSSLGCLFHALVSLSSFYACVMQLSGWSSDLVTPLSLWLPGLFNPMAFVTAIMQVTARATGLPLDKMSIETHVTTMLRPDVRTPLSARTHTCLLLLRLVAIYTSFLAVWLKHSLHNHAEPQAHTRAHTFTNVLISPPSI